MPPKAPKPEEKKLRAPRHATTHQNLVKLTLELQKRREEIQTSIDKGAPITTIATKFNVATSTMKTLLEQLDFVLPLRSRKTPTALNDILTVVIRIARELNVNYDEIKHYQP